MKLKSKINLSGRFRHRKGAIIPLVAILLPILIAVAGFGIFLAYAQLVRTELRTVVDFSARAGAKRLSMDQSAGAAVNAALDIASRNPVGGRAFSLDASNILVGEARQLNGQESRFEFTENGARPNSVRVTGISSGNQNLSNFLANMAGISNRQFQVRSTATNLDRDICVVIDRSGSMCEFVNSSNGGSIGKCGPLDPNTRFAALGRAVDIFVDELNQTPQQELVCLASYSTNVRFPCNCCPQVISVNPTTGQPDQTDPCPRVGRGCGGPTQYFVEFNEAEIHSNLSPDTNALRGPIQAMINRGIGGGTSIGSGLQQGMAAVTGANSRPFAFPTIILMTDGNHNNGIGPEVVAQQALNDGIVVHTITFSPGANQALMKQVAETTGGRHLHADSEDDLKDAFRALARTLPVMLTQ